MLRKRADIVLVDRGFFPSRAKAREAIEAGLVSAKGAQVRKSSEMIEEDAEIVAEKPYPWVSRGGVKLAAALAEFGIVPAGRDCVDIGSSTGGFTHVLLESGASRVYAVDVGQGQFSPALAGDPRVTLLEKTDARNLTEEQFAMPPQLAVFDVSFISLKLVLPAVLPLLAADAAMVALIKPQFEAGREKVAKGVVRDASVHHDVCETIRTCVEAEGWRVAGLVPSPIEGGDGNREFLIGAMRGAPLLATAG
ncbi:MAG: TlyA family RNA methyltransferase [Beijerinckiaceae bacterium]